MEEKEFDSINIIPFVDIMLVLLAIILATASFIATGEIPVNLPAAKNKEAKSHPAVVITLTADNRLFLNEDEVNGRIEEVLNRFNRDNPVIIRADRGVYVERLINVIDAIKGSRFGRVSMEVTGR